MEPLKPINLESHPEGGKFRRVFCSNVKVVHPEFGERAALSHIYFEIYKNDKSRMHRVANDEVWNLYRGDGVYIYIWDGTAREVEIFELSERANSFCHVVPAGMWQAAMPILSDVLVGCSVAPAFDFEDFTLLKDDLELRDRFLEGNPELGKLV